MPRAIEQNVISPELALAMAANLDSEIERLAAGPGDVGATARAVLRLRRVGAPADELEVVARPILNAFCRALHSEQNTQAVKIAKPRYSRKRKE
jgi:hypothetical protein